MLTIDPKAALPWPHKAAHLVHGVGVLHMQRVEAPNGVRDRRGAQDRMAGGRVVDAADVAYVEDPRQRVIKRFDWSPMPTTEHSNNGHNGGQIQIQSPLWRCGKQQRTGSSRHHLHYRQCPENQRSREAGLHEREQRREYVGGWATY